MPPPPGPHFTPLSAVPGPGQPFPDQWRVARQILADWEANGPSVRRWLDDRGLYGFDLAEPGMALCLFDALFGHRPVVGGPDDLIVLVDAAWEFDPWLTCAADAWDYDPNLLRPELDLFLAAFGSVLWEDVVARSDAPDVEGLFVPTDFRFGFDAAGWMRMWQGYCVPTRRAGSPDVWLRDARVRILRHAWSAMFGVLDGAPPWPDTDRPGYFQNGLIAAQEWVRRHRPAARTAGASGPTPAGGRSRVTVTLNPELVVIGRRPEAPSVAGASGWWDGCEFPQLWEGERATETGASDVGEHGGLPDDRDDEDQGSELPGAASPAGGAGEPSRPDAPWVFDDRTRTVRIGGTEITFAPDHRMAYRFLAAVGPPDPSTRASIRDILRRVHGQSGNPWRRATNLVSQVNRQLRRGPGVGDRLKLDDRGGHEVVCWGREV